MTTSVMTNQKIWFGKDEKSSCGIPTASPAEWLSTPSASARPSPLVSVSSVAIAGAPFPVGPAGQRMPPGRQWSLVLDCEHQQQEQRGTRRSPALPQNAIPMNMVAVWTGSATGCAGRPTGSCRPRGPHRRRRRPCRYRPDQRRCMHPFVRCHLPCEFSLRWKLSVD